MERLLKSRYKIKDRIGEGPFSITYKGSYLERDDPLVIKIYKRSVLSSSLIKVVKRKVRELCALTHKNIAKVIDGDYGWQGFYFVREFVQGSSLSEVIKNEGKLSVERSVEIISQVLDGLSAAHAKGIVHGALSPNNVFVSSGGVIKLTDFIIVPEMRSSVRERAEMAFNDPSFMPPEEVEGAVGSEQSDIYAAGLLLYIMLSGKHPFSSTSRLATALKILRDVPEKLSNTQGDVPHYIESIISKCLEKDPLMRFRSVNALEHSLKSKMVVSEEKVPEEFADVSLEGLIEETSDVDSLPGEPIEREPIRKSAFWTAAVIFAAACLGIGYAVISSMKNK